MKILVVTQYYFPESFKINDLTQELVKRGHKVTVYTSLPNYPYGKFFDGYSILKGPYSEIKDGVEIVRIPQPPRGKNKGFGLILNYLFFGFFGSILAPFKLKKDFDCIFIYGLSPIFLALPGIILKKIWKIPVVFWVADLWPESLEATGITKNNLVLGSIRKFTNWIYHNCDIILTTSRGFINEIQKQNIQINKLIFWPQWAEPIFDDLNKISSYNDSEFPINKFVVLFAGNIGTSQDMSTLLKSAEILKSNEDIAIVIIGDGLALNDSKKKARELNLKNVVFLGRKPLETMPYYFSKSDVLIVSLVDTFLFSITIPSKIQTYLASKKPILASLNGEGGKLIKDWNAGVQVNASSPEDLGNAILKLSRMSETDRDVLGENAYRCYKELFDRDKLISQLENIFESVN